MELMLIGAGGHGRVVADIASLLEIDTVFVDDAWPNRKKNGIWTITGTLDAVEKYEGNICVTVGDNLARDRLWRKFEQKQPAPLLSHPSAVISKYANFGFGTVVMAGAVINYGAHIGKGVIVNTGARIDHDCQIADMVHLSPGSILAGGVVVGRRSWVGAGAIVREKVRIGEDVVVGAGAVVLADVSDNQRVAGVPARVLA